MSDYERSIRQRIKKQMKEEFGLTIADEEEEDKMGKIADEHMTLLELIHEFNEVRKDFEEMGLVVVTFKGKISIQNSSGDELYYFISVGTMSTYIRGVRDGMEMERMKNG